MSLDRIKESLAYDPATGLFTWIQPRQGIEVGSVAGSASGTLSDYVRIMFEGRTYLGHRLAWWWVHGTWPARIDHKDGCGTNNRIGNLRPCTQRQNRANSRARKSGSSRFKGVTFCQQTRKWRAQIDVGGKHRCLGRHANEEDAARAYDAVLVELHGEFARTNF